MAEARLALVPRALMPWTRSAFLGPLVLIRRDVARRAGAARVLAHELVHYDQWRSRGTRRFVRESVAAWATAGYRWERTPVEALARTHERDKHYLARATALLARHPLTARAATVRA